MSDTLYPNTPPAIKSALFSLINKDFKSEADKNLNNFLLDTLNDCEKAFSKFEIDKLK
jgi:hypothetical protein